MALWSNTVSYFIAQTHTHKHEEYKCVVVCLCVLMAGWGRGGYSRLPDELQGQFLDNLACSKEKNCCFTSVS